MDDTTVRIFFSWQSDLPANDTRNIIQDSIEAAVRLLRGTVEIEADRDTKGEYGSPDIATTIFKKIDSCDIFIADVSSVNTYEVKDKNGNKRIKCTPNPNVMIELGYATRAVGWENVICILNTDYGNVENMPFDISNRRLTTFSLNSGKSKADIRKELKSIIQDTVENLIEHGKKPKTGFSSLKVGSFENGKITGLVSGLDITSSNNYLRLKNNYIEECKRLLKEIRQIKLTHWNFEKSINVNGDNPKVDTTNPINNVSSSIESISKAMAKYINTTSVIISDKDRDEINKMALLYIDEEIDDEFYYLGDLKRKVSTFVVRSEELEGEEDEIEKYNKIRDFHYQLLRIHILDMYVKTYAQYMLIPLAIINESTISDEDIDVYISIDSMGAKVVAPSRNLIYSELIGMEGIIYEEEILKDLLMMPSSSDIGYENDISYSPVDLLASSQPLYIPGVNGTPRPSEEDYERELAKYIAAPMPDSKSEYCFTINSLRPNEKKWLEGLIVLELINEDVTIDYSIKSKKSSGKISGKLTLRK